MANESEDYSIVPYTDCDQSYDLNCVPSNNDNMNETYIYRNRCVTSYFPVEHWYQLRNKSQCDCHKECQCVPFDNTNNDDHLPKILINHITDYWKSLPLNNIAYFPDDNPNPFNDFIPLPSPYVSIYDDNVNSFDDLIYAPSPNQPIYVDYGMNNNGIGIDPIPTEGNTQDDINRYVDGDPIIHYSPYSPYHPSPNYSVNQNDIPNGSYDHPFIID
jgi:hypothetical protein